MYIYMYVMNVHLHVHLHVHVHVHVHVHGTICMMSTLLKKKMHYKRKTLISCENNCSNFNKVLGKILFYTVYMYTLHQFVYFYCTSYHKRTSVCCVFRHENNKKKKSSFLAWTFGSKYKVLHTRRSHEILKSAVRLHML